MSRRRLCEFCDGSGLYVAQSGLRECCDCDGTGYRVHLPSPAEPPVGDSDGTERESAAKEPA